ncbi:MAG TPA: hypothetical protein QGF58_11600 [Myxococcota bacterium]|nr:hypothetical protein [Myxococcota bacterium]
MSWPAWIEELKIRYLADESNVFLLHGDAVLSGRWAVPGEIVDCADLVRRFLEPSRDIVGVFDPDPSDGKAPPDVRRSAMDFRGVEDIGQFRRLVEVRFTLDGVRARKRMDTPEGALGLVWIALTTRGKDQGYIVKKTDKVLNSRRKNPPPFDHGAPPLVEWPGHAGFEGTNNVVVLLAADLSTVRSDLVEACAKIEVTPHHAQLAEAEFAPVGDEQAAATAEIEDALSLKRAPKPPPMEEAEAELDRALAGEDELSMRREEEDPPAAEPVTEPLPDIVDLLPTEPLPEVALPPPTTAEEIDLPERVDQALRATILRHPEGDWPQNLPGREAVALVVHEVAPERCGLLSMEVVDEQVVAVGEGAEWFSDWYKKDIALDAACGMALGALEVPEGGFTAENLPELERPAINALARRIGKLLG